MSQTVIRCVGLSKNYGHLRAVSDLNMELREGETISVTGSNGSGKTTLMKMLCGILTPSSGEIFIEKPVGYMSQSSALIPRLTTKENYDFYGVVNSIKRGERERRFKEVAEQFGLDRFKNKRVEELTAGWRQLLSFSVAIMGEPRVLLLDEPTAGVDTLTRQKIWECIMKMAESGCAVVVTSHYQTEVRLCGRNLHMERPVQL
jgi:ABC-2 type transport system ATP-binding protein